jgi:hypothetical protein
MRGSDAGIVNIVSDMFSLAKATSPKIGSKAPVTSVFFGVPDYFDIVSVPGIYQLSHCFAWDGKGRTLYWIICLLLLSRVFPI